MPTEEAVDRDNPYARLVTIEGQSYYEVGLKGPGEDGYNVRYIEVQPDADPGELKHRVKATLDDIRKERNGAATKRSTSVPNELTLTQDSLDDDSL